MADERIFELERPDPALMTYYALTSLFAGPFFFVPLALLFFRYHTLRYRFDDEGISMRWGILFRREIHLTYARIQDLHLVSNVVERWLGLGRIKVQTASGSAKAEMTIEGIRELEALRDFLYARMRGAAAGPARAGRPAAPGDRPALSDGVADELTATLKQVADELAAVRRALAERRGGSGGAGGA